MPIKLGWNHVGCGLASLLVFAALGVSAEVAALAATSPSSTAGTHTASSTLVMPFDAMPGKATFLSVSNIAGVTYRAASGNEEGEFGEEDSDDPFGDATQVSGTTLGISTHWSFWDERGEHLAETFNCLTLNDTVVVDVRALAGQDAGNQPVGPPVDLSGLRGFVVVTSYATDRFCRPPTETTPFPIPGGLIGSYTIADIASGSAFGQSAFGLAYDEEAGRTRLPTAEIEALVATTLNPATLERSDLILIALEEARGHGEFAEIEVGPTSEVHLLSTTFSDTTEIPTSLPDVHVGAATFLSVSSPQPGDDFSPSLVTRLLPASATLDSAGIIRFRQTESQIGGDSRRLIVGFHGQALGEFGAGSIVAHQLPRATPGQSFFETHCCAGAGFYECSDNPGAFRACITDGGNSAQCCQSTCTLSAERVCDAPMPTSTADGASAYH